MNKKTKDVRKKHKKAVERGKTKVRAAKAASKGAKRKTVAKKPVAAA